MLTRRPGVAGRVVAGDGTAIDGATVRATFPDGTRLRRTTDPAGRFSLPAERAVAATLTAEHRRFATARREGIAFRPGKIVVLDEFVLVEQGRIVRKDRRRRRGAGQSAAASRSGRTEGGLARREHERDGVVHAPRRRLHDRRHRGGALSTVRVHARLPIRPEGRRTPRRVDVRARNGAQRTDREDRRRPRAGSSRPRLRHRRARATGRRRRRDRVELVGRASDERAGVVARRRREPKPTAADASS